MEKYCVFVLAITLAAAQPAVAENLVINGGFETVYDTTGPRPTGYGYWRGNFSEIVPTSQGITPFEGSQMLNFIYTIESGPALTKDSEVWQIIDISSFGSQISAGQALASASFRFNRIEGDAETDTEFTIGLYAYAGDPCSFPSQYETSELAARLTSVFSDGDPNTWELATADLILPPNTDFLVVESAARENIFNDASAPELDGHYADAVSVTICSRPVIYVDADANGANDGSNWADAFNCLQDALAAAISGVVIKGGYAGLGEPDPNARDVQLYETILSGDLAGNDGDVTAPLELVGDPCRAENSYHVVTGSGADETAVLNGFTITAGYADGSYPANRGGGIYNNGGSPVLVNCTVRKNVAAIGGGMKNRYGSPTLTNCTFSRNWAAVGGGMDNYAGSPILTSCTFSGNWADLDEGGMANGYGDPILTNCTFSGNRALLMAGGMGNSYGSATLTNCTLTGNYTSAGYGSGVANYDNSSLTVTNCILWGNTDYYGSTDEAVQIFGGTSVVNHCCIQGWTGALGGTGNFGYDPCFAEPGYWDANGAWVEGNYHLLPSSPCIDVGDNNNVPADVQDLDGDGNMTEPIPWDLDGNARIVDGNNDGNSVVDMGAYEYFVPPIEVAMKFTPQALNPGSKGKWVKAHFVLPEEYTVEDVDVNTPAVVQPGDIESDYINVFINEEGLVGVEAAFDRREFCGIVTDGQPMEVSVIGSFISGQQFCGTDTIKITTNTFEYLAVLANYWLEADCGKPDWCEGADLDQDSMVNFTDFVMFDGCCIEIVTE
jgi:hypothetical protein